MEKQKVTNRQENYIYKKNTTNSNREVGLTLPEIKAYYKVMVIKSIRY